jgi:hypothetical protein
MFLLRELVAEEDFINRRQVLDQNRTRRNLKFKRFYVTEILKFCRRKLVLVLSASGRRIRTRRTGLTWRRDPECKDALYYFIE